jgi:hypothetical protein
VGDSATDPTARRAVRMAAQVPTYLLANFAIIGLDRRGAGTDTLDCADPSARSALADADPATADTTLLLERARAVVQACNVALDGQLGGFSSEAAADDIEAVRQALGVARRWAPATAPRRSPTGRAPTPARSAGSSWTGRPTRVSTSPRARRPGRRRPKRHSTRSPSAARPAARARWVRTRAPR